MKINMCASVSCSKTLYTDSCVCLLRIGDLQHAMLDHLFGVRLTLNQLSHRVRLWLVAGLHYQKEKQMNKANVSILCSSASS
jgi:hypothetical protein